MNKFPSHGDLQAWVAFLDNDALPILSSTKRLLDSLLLQTEILLPSELSVAILRDPLLTTSILRYIQQHKNKLRRLDITTVEHAAMMIGIEPFFKIFGNLATVDSSIGMQKNSVEALLRIAKRSYIASRLAQDWAAKAKDIESEEAQVAALIRDVAEMLLWIKAPGHAMAIKNMMDADPSIRSKTAQTKYMGFPLTDLEIELCRRWGLPQILIDLLLAKDKTNRTKQVELAVRIARHSSKGWTDAALPDDWSMAVELLHFKTEAQAQSIIIPQVEDLARRWDKHNAPKDDEDEDSSIGIEQT